MDSNHEMKHSHNENSNRLMIGLLLIVAGAILIVKKTTMLPPGLDHFINDIVFSWQMLLIAIGLVVFTGSSNKTPGIVMMSVGGFFLLLELFNDFFSPFNFFWPALFIIIGILMIVGSYKKRETFTSYTSSEKTDMIDYINVFSGAERQLISDNFSGGKFTAVFGGGEVDLTKCHLAPGVSSIEVTCVFGGVTFIVPEDWDITLEITPILGGFSDSRKIRGDVQRDTSKRLVIKGIVIFGGGEIKCFK
jgi:predicted membrane protein